MIVSIHQPAFNPWLGYFDKIKSSDHFVYLDTVQFEKNSFTNRNKMTSASGDTFWMTLPVSMKNHTQQTMEHTTFADHKWKRKHLNTLNINYKKAPFFDECYPLLEKIYAYETTNFSDFCFNQLVLLCDHLKITTKLSRSSELKIDGAKSELVLNICQGLKASTYISGALGKDYLNTEEFLKNNIEVIFQDYQHPTYNQIHGEFVSHLGIFDFLFNCNDPDLI